MITIREEVVSDIPAREALLDLCLGERRTAKSSERLREGRLPADGLALVAERDGAVVATVRLWHVEANGRPAVKLSDNPEKATGTRAEIERYIRIFGAEGRVEHTVKV